MANRTSMDNMAVQLEDIAKDITGTPIAKGGYAWDIIDSAVTTIAEAVGAELPEKKFSTKKDRVAALVNAIADADVGGGGGAVQSDVNFVDYDGTIVDSYSAADFAKLTEMPKNPSHKGLTAQGWNWSFENAQSYVAKYGRLDVGQMYITDDGTTRVYIHVEKELSNPMLGVCPNGTVEVDWGDGTAHDILTGTDDTVVKWTPNHNYNESGDFVIKLTVTGSMGFYYSVYSGPGLLTLRGDNDYSKNIVFKKSIKKIEIGNGISVIPNNAFNGCECLESITIPNSVSSIGEKAFNDCYRFEGVIIPDGTSSIAKYAFRNTYADYIVISESVTSLGDDPFSGCNFSRITIPEGLTVIGQELDYSVSGVFVHCQRLTNIVLPDTVTFIGKNLCSSCNGIVELHVASINPPTLVQYSLAADAIYVPAGSVDAYKAAEAWSDYANIIQAEPE